MYDSNDFRITCVQIKTMTYMHNYILNYTVAKFIDYFSMLESLVSILWCLV